MASDDYWPEGEAWKTPPEVKDPHPICPRCGARHVDPLPWCSRRNEETTDG